jgi:hypothetical protein
MKRINAFIFSAFLLFAGLLYPNISYADHQVNEQFTPYKGQSNISEDSTSRYSKQLMYWRTGSLKEFDSWNDTYEHETIFYNYDGSAYATKPTSYQTNLPDP